MEEKKYSVSPGTIARYIILILSLINLVLNKIGKSPIPIDDAFITEFISITWVIVASLVAAYKNNSTSQEALAGDELMRKLKAEKKELDSG
jgi:SPP1 family holin